MDENQNLGMSVQQLNPTWWLKQRASNFVNYQNAERQKHVDTANAETDNQIKSVWGEWINATDHWIAEECNKATRKQLVAKGIRDYFWNTEWEDYSEIKDWQLIDGYIASNPDSKIWIYDFILDENQICDPTELYQSMWWIEPDVIEEEVVEEEPEDDWNFIINSLKNYAQAFFERGWQAVANIVNGAIDEIEQGTILDPGSTDYTMSARENYAQMNYGTTYGLLTPEQRAECDEILATEEWMEMYKPSVQRVLSRMAEAWLDAYWMIKQPVIQALMAVWQEVPYLQDVIEVFWDVVTMGWWLINKLPLLKQFRDSLQTEQEKQEWDQTVGTLWFMKLFQKRWKRISKDKIWETILKEIDPITTIKEFQKRLEELPADAKNLGKKISEKMPTQWEMIAKINKMTAGEKFEFENKFGGEKYGDFLNRIGILEWDEWAINKLNAYKSDLFNQVTNALEQIGWDHNVNNPWMAEMIRENLRNAKDVMERDPSILNKLWEISEKYFKEVKNPDWSTRIYWKLNASEIKFLMRYFAEKTRLWFNKENEPKKVQRHDNIYAQALDDITRIAEENWFENMSEMSRDIQKSHYLIKALGKDIAKKYGKSWLDAADILALYGDVKSGGIKFVLKRVLTSEWAKKNYVKILNKLEWLTPERQRANLEKIKEISSKNMFDNWVKEIEKDANTPKLWENPQYSNNPVDYTSPTRVEPTWEAWRYWQTVETLKNTWLDPNKK